MTDISIAIVIAAAFGVGYLVASIRHARPTEYDKPLTPRPASSALLSSSLGRSPGGGQLVRGVTPRKRRRFS